MVTVTRPPGATDAVSKDRVALGPFGCAATEAMPTRSTTPAIATAIIVVNIFLFKLVLSIVLVRGVPQTKCCGTPGILL